MINRLARPAMLVALALVLAACVPLPPLAETASPPAAVEYNLGEATIVQAGFPADSRFRHMPVRLNGLIAAPTEGDGPFPVVVVIHGTHPGCPVDEMGVDRWPCAPDVEQRNYSGFAYLASALAARGYVVLAPNFNAEHTFGFGEPVPGERLAQVLDLHLQALAAAAAGGSNEFGVDLARRPDLGRLALIGHSRGGEAAVALANSPEMLAASRGYGPVAGLVLIAAAATAVDPWRDVSAPMATILSACDGDVVSQDGQFFYEGARLSPKQTQWATSIWLERANHNGFNSILPRDMVTHADRPDCQPLLDGETQRDWLVTYATDFLTVIFGADSSQQSAARTRMGLDVTVPAVDELYAQAGRVAYLAPAADRRTLFLPAGDGELTTNLLGGAVTTVGVMPTFCPKGFYNAQLLPGSEPCRRNYVTVPGQPAHAVFSWEGPGAAVRFALPAGASGDAGDLSGYTTLTLRAAVDPASPLNAAGQPQAFSVQLTDRTGHRATVSTRPNEPALRFPPGAMEADQVLQSGFFTGRVPMTEVRLPLSAFTGVDLAQISEVALVFDQTAAGTLFVADLEWVRIGE